MAAVSGLSDRPGLAARVLLGAMAIMIAVAVVLTWFLLGKDREAHLAEGVMLVRPGGGR